MRTVKEWDDDPEQLFPQSRVSVNHNKAVSSIVLAVADRRTALSDVSNCT